MADLAVALGYSADARVLIPHIDDVGVCHGANRAFAELAGEGFVTTASVMVPCPWFPETVELVREQPGLDLGVHLTLTSESRACRWRPISTSSKQSGLIDADGFMWPDVPSVRRHAERRAVETELRAQIEGAVAAGIDVTHLDTHMGAAAAPEFVEIYLALGREYRLPVLLPERIETYVSVLDMGPVDTDLYEQLQAEARAANMPAIDVFVMGLAMRHLGCEEAFRQMVEQSAPGVTYVSLHCSTPGEVERLHPQDAEWRIAEYQLFDQPGFLDWVARQDVELIGFRPVRDLYREQSPPERPGAA
jgi:chitin disaccharide deacetylase